MALDIVGPLPRTSRGHKYILVLVDYATATATAVARELMLLFSRVGIAREVLTDQGSCFMSRVMKELLKSPPGEAAEDIRIPSPDGRPGRTVQQNPQTNAEEDHGGGR